MRIPMNVGEAREKRAVGILLAHAHLHGNVIFVAKRLKIGMFVKEAVENVAPGAPLAAYFDENVFAGFFRLPARSIQVFFRMATIPVAIRKKRSEEHTSELQSRLHLVCRLLLEKKKKRSTSHSIRINNVPHPASDCTVRRRKIVTSAWHDGVLAPISVSF